MKKVIVLVFSFLMTAFGSMQAMQENPYPAWEFIKNVDNESNLTQITTLKNLHEFNLIADDFPEDNGIPNYIKTLVDMKRYYDLQNFLDAVLFPYIPENLSITACTELIQYVKSMPEDEALEHWQSLKHLCTLKLLLNMKAEKNIKFVDNLEANVYCPDDILRFNVLQNDVLLGRADQEWIRKKGIPVGINIFGIYGKVALNNLDYTFICPHIRMYLQVEQIKFGSKCLNRIPMWIDCIESLNKIYVDETVEIPEALRNHPRIKIFSHTGLLLNKYL